MRRAYNFLKGISLKVNVIARLEFKLTYFDAVNQLWFGLVWLHGISTIVSYLMPNLLYTYILIIYD